MGFVANPYVYFKKAEFLIMTSELEGFPMVLIESLACGTPVVSYDCPTGPREIIQHEKNGLLVKANDKGKMTDSLNRMIEDSELYNKLRANAKNSVAHLSMDKIAAEWKSLIEKV
jgi:N-acetylgalactosamine-N,N'-diacetylbacillosaminyl-diphospho-undecaprenol 4-alpha-N-acetylgalactosaminyltransferase